MLLSCDKAFQDPCHSETREQKYVQQHIRICTHGAKTGLGKGTYIPIPGLSLPVAGRGGGSNTTHALLSPDPETLRIGEAVPPRHRRVPRNQVAPKMTDSGFQCSLNGRPQLHSGPEIRPRHYPLGVVT